MRSDKHHRWLWYKQKRLPVRSESLFSSTQSRGRTGTGVTPLVFETSASTDSAIWAFGIVGKHCGAKVLKIYKYQNLILLPL